MGYLDVKEIRKKNNVTQGKLAKLCDVSLRTIQNWEKNPDSIPYASAQFLMSLADGASTGDDTSPDGSIQLIPVEVMAGYMKGEQNVQPYEYIMYQLPSFSDCDFLVTVSGDSMTPRYNGGDIVACKKLSLRDIFFQWGRVYVVNTSQGALIKKVERGSSEETITLVSENEAYGPFEIRRDMIYDIALVCGVIKKE
jgi:phage repressor protein C with HTH and peptisase S24 domain